MRLEGSLLVDARQGEQIFDQLAHPLGFALDAAHGGLDVVVVLEGTVTVQLGKSANGDQGCTKFMRSVRDEAAHLPF